MRAAALSRNTTHSPPVPQPHQGKQRVQTQHITLYCRQQGAVQPPGLSISPGTVSPVRGRVLADWIASVEMADQQEEAGGQQDETPGKQQEGGGEAGQAGAVDPRVQRVRQEWEQAAQ